MLFTVVVPVFNRAEIVTRTLDSIAAQAHRPLRLIIVDNGSTDDSLAVVTRWADAQRTPDFPIDILTEPRPGACAARNRGLREVTTPYVIFFDSDDAMRPGLIEAYRQAFTANPDAALAITGVSIHNLDGSTRNFPVHPVSHSTLVIRHLQHAWLRTQGYAVLTSHMRACGGWDETLPCWNDLELGLRLLLCSEERRDKREEIKAVFIPGIYVDIYAQRVSITGTSFSSRAANLNLSLDTLTHDILASPYTYNNKGALTRDGRRFLFMVDLRRAILAGACAREGSPQTGTITCGEPLCASREAYAPNLPTRYTLFPRLLLKLAYHLTRHGIRGASRLIALYH